MNLKVTASTIPSIMVGQEVELVGNPTQMTLSSTKDSRTLAALKKVEIAFSRPSNGKTSLSLTGEFDGRFYSIDLV